ncbi:hypothetical protein [Pseudomonas koreensis]|uniref:hypothetical protein n=1 Tax=Pseudomonas koreensis TaxID=198620 RepID=UPI00207715A9|nr:hypothetical protein [Pseudomonas koreensis]MCM8743608.1 hypothetical protein [Pseudomonas koreensis]
MSTNTKLKIFYGAAPEVGQPAAGFVIESADAPFTEDSFVQTAPVDSMVTAEGLATQITAGDVVYDLERVNRTSWMQLMARLEEFRNPIPNAYQPT